MSAVARKVTGFIQRLLGVSPFFITNVPKNPATMPLLERSPDGLALIYSAHSSSEAELLRQVLNEAGFHAEFVPSVLTGLYGMTENHDIHVHADEQREAEAFLREYLEGAPGMPEEAD